MGQATAIMSGAKQPDLDAYFEQAIPVLTFLGAIMFAGLVLNVSTPNFYNQVNSTAFVKFISPLPPSWYNGGVQALMGLLAVFSAVGAFASVHMRAFRKGYDEAAAHSAFRFVRWSIRATTFGLGFAIFFLLLPFSRGSAVLEVAGFIASWAWFARVSRGFGGNESHR